MTIVIHQINFGPPVAELLASCGLPTDDLAASRRVTFYGTEPAPSQGVVALEDVGTVALLRSLAVAPEFRGRGLGTALVAHAEAAATNRGVAELYLLTTSARAYFAERGYREVPRSSAPSAIVALPQFTTLCPSSAALMVKRHVG
jgi:amino-acid N-acetyltransferase